MSFSLSVLKFGVVLGGGYLSGEDGRGGGVLVGGGGVDGGDDVILGDGGGYLCRVTGKFVSFSLSVLKFGVVRRRGGGGSNNEKDAGGGG